MLTEVVPALTQESVEVHEGGEPDPNCGEWFAAVWQGEWRGDSRDWDLSERCGVNVTLTRRLGYAPEDRWGPVVWADLQRGFYKALRKILVNVHLSEKVRIAANGELGIAAGGAGGFVEALRFQSGGSPEKKGPDWFGAAEPLDRIKRVANAGLAQTLVFGDALRVQGRATENLT